MTDAPVWDPRQYSRFEAERDRAALDLLVRLPADLNPREIWDLGCGAGQHAALLKRRHPDATVRGLDSSAAMLDQGRALDVAVDWRLGDIAGWTPEAPVDLILANASLHWVPDHEGLFPRLAGALASGGVLAVQMPPDDTAHHRVLEMTAGEGPWAESLVGAGRPAPLLSPDRYFDLLAPLCRPVDLWSTTYLHALGGADPVLEWMKGAALRPYLSRLESDPVMMSAFLEALGAALSRAFPRRDDGVTLLPFPRLFLVARRR